MESNYTVTTTPKKLPQLPIFAYAKLNQISFGENPSFVLRLQDENLLKVENCLRIIPRRRLVTQGIWKGRNVIAKLFFDPTRATSQAKKEIIGVKMLKETNIPTAELLYHGKSADNRVHVLIFERIMQAENLEEILYAPMDEASRLEIFKRVITELATQHVLGILQEDLHYRNFLVNEKKIYSLDGAKIKRLPMLLPRQDSIDHLALFLAQMGSGMHGVQNILFQFYATLRGWQLKKKDFLYLHLKIKKINSLRWLKFQKKIFRNSTDFKKIKSWQLRGMLANKFNSPQLRELLTNPEKFFALPEHKILKAGHSATVIKVELGAQQFVVKRYNIKHFWHFLKRSLRKTRAKKSWRIAQKLNLFGVPTPTPVAYIEQHFLGLSGWSYYISEYIEGDHAAAYINKYASHPQKINEAVSSITHLLKKIFQLEITHGDLKATNILIDGHHQPIIIDLDGTYEHSSLSSFRFAWQKEVTRFLQNFKDHPQLHEQFRQAFSK